MIPTMRLVSVLAAVAACSKASSPVPEKAEARVAAWREDLRVFATELPARHVHAFFHADEATWRRHVAELDAQLDKLDDAHVIDGLARLAAELHDAHTFPGIWNRGGYYPLSLVWFDDGIFVVGATDRAAIGKRVTAIGDVAIDEVVRRLGELVSSDNAITPRWHVPEMLVDAAILAGVDVRPPYRFADGTALDVKPGPHAAPLALPQPLPLHLQTPRPGAIYWNKPVGSTIYLQYNACEDDPRGEPFAAFAAGTLAYADAHAVDRIVIDLRSNIGGDSRIMQPLIDGLAARRKLAVFAIIGSHTFSSAIVNAMDLRRHARAKLVGGPTPGAPSGYGEIKLFELPHSKIAVQYSTKQFSNPDFPSDTLRPDLPVTVTSVDWFAGRDPAMDAILADR